MRYQQISGASSYPYPLNNIDPDKKDDAWCMQYAKAAYFDFTYMYPKGVFYNNGGDYEKFRLYALGKQPITQYKKWLGVDSTTDETWLTVDWTVRPVVSRYRDRAISRLMKQTHGIVATPIDMLAKSDLDQYYAQLKAKLAVRQLIQQVNQQGELGSHPMITLQPGEPMDTEELEMRVNLGEQFNRAKDAEEAIELGFYENGIEHKRRTIFSDLFDLGLSGYKEWLGEDNKAKFRIVNPECVIINLCKQANFSDLVHAGEVIDISLIDLAMVKNADGTQKFSDEMLTEFAGTIAGKWGNPTMIGRATGWFKPYDKFKCKVLDMEFYSYNEYVFKSTTDANGNADFRKAPYGRGKQSDKFTRKRVKVVYKVKWIVGTDYCYDAGLVQDSKRTNDMENFAETSLSYKFYAFNFYEMRAQGIMERLIPYLDDYQLTMLKIQNFKNRAVPSGWWIDMDALENVALNKGGKNMTPKELLTMFFQSGVLLGRSKDAANNPMGPNWKPIIPIENTAASELAMLYQDLVQTITQIESTTGYNSVTAGDPNPKMLIPGYETANISTDDALYPLAFSESQLVQQLASDVLLRQQQGLKKGGVSGFARALNGNTLRFYQLSPTIAARDYGIELEEKTSDEQKAWLMQQLNMDIQNGFLDTSDAILIMNTHNAKQALEILSYRVKKAKEAMAQQKQQEIQLQNQGNIQSAQIASQQALQTLQMELQSKERMKMIEIQGELAKEKIKQEYVLQGVREQNNAKQGVASTTGQAKIIAQTIAAASKESKSES